MNMAEQQILWLLQMLIDAIGCNTSYLTTQTLLVYTRNTYRRRNNAEGGGSQEYLIRPQNNPGLTGQCHSR